MGLDDGVSEVDSVMFTDIQVSYNRQFADQALSLTAGINNVLDEDPPVCFPCGVIGMSTVSHDLPGRVGYLRLSYEI
jgi:iron complex outermembrane receptor protein